ncbi:MAG: hypothetical protein U0353_33460 [Sandaracinus sp.]
MRQVTWVALVAWVATGCGGQAANVSTSSADDRAEAHDDPAAEPHVVAPPSFAAEEVTAITFTRPGGETLRMTRDAEHWQLEGTLRGPASQTWASDLLEDLAAVPEALSLALRVAHEGLAAIEGDEGELLRSEMEACEARVGAWSTLEPARTIAVVVARGAEPPISLWVGLDEGCGTPIATSAEERALRVWMPQRSYARAMEDVRETELSYARIGELVELRFEGAHAPWTYRQDERTGHWQLAPIPRAARGAQPRQPIASERIAELASHLRALHARALGPVGMTPAEAGIDASSPHLTWVLRRPDDSQVEQTLRVGRPVDAADGPRYVVRDGTETIYALSSRDAALLEGIDVPAEAAAAPPSAQGTGGSDEVPPEVMEQLRRQMQQQTHSH